MHRAYARLLFLPIIFPRAGRFEPSD